MNIDLSLLLNLIFPFCVLKSRICLRPFTLWWFWIYVIFCHICHILSFLSWNSWTHWVSSSVAKQWYALFLVKSFRRNLENMFKWHNNSIVWTMRWYLQGLIPYSPLYTNFMMFLWIKNHVGFTGFCSCILYGNKLIEIEIEIFVRWNVYVSWTLIHND